MTPRSTGKCEFTPEMYELTPELMAERQDTRFAQWLWLVAGLATLAGLTRGLPFIGAAPSPRIVLWVGAAVLLGLVGARRFRTRGVGAAVGSLLTWFVISAGIQVVLPPSP